MLELMSLDSVWTVILAQCTSFIWFLACLTVSIYGGNEPGKPLPDTYTYEQYQEYKRIHGAEATRKKVRELEARRAEKEKLDRRRAQKVHGGGVAQKRPVGSAAKTTKTAVEKPGDSGKAGSKEVKQSKEPTTCREKSKVNPLAMLDTLGFSTKKVNKKKKKKRTETLKSHDPLEAHGKRKGSKKKGDEAMSDGDISDKKQNKHKRFVTSGERCDGTLTPVDMGSSHFSKEGSTASPSTKQTTPTTSAETTADPKRLRAKWANKIQKGDMVQSPLTARETTRKEKNNGAFPKFSPSPVSPKGPKEDDDFSPTVFENVNAPVRPVVDNGNKKKKKKEEKRQPTLDETALAAIRVNLAKPAGTPDGNDVAVDMEEPQAIPVEVKLKKIKEKLRRKHSKTVLQMEKKKKRKSAKNESSAKKKQPPLMIALGGKVAPIQVQQPLVVKKKSKKKRLPKKAAISATQTKTETSSNKKEVKVLENDGATAELTVEENKTCVAVNNDKTVETIDMDTNTEVSFDECDTEEDSVDSLEMYRLAKLDLRRTKSSRRYRATAPEKLKMTASARLFGRYMVNARCAAAEYAAIAKGKNTAKKPLTPTSPSCTTSPTTCSTPPTPSTSTTWSNVTVSGAKDPPPIKKIVH